jgi:hypothetical protein
LLVSLEGIDGFVQLDAALRPVLENLSDLPVGELSALLARATRMPQHSALQLARQCLSTLIEADYAVETA